LTISQLLRFATLLAVLAACSRVLPGYALELATRIGIFAIFAMSLDLLVGYLGLSSLGHAAFFGVSGYAVGLVALGVTGNILVVIAAALSATLMVALVFVALALRASGVYFLMLTLALAQIAWGLAFQWRSLTGGDDGLPGIPRPFIGSAQLTDPADFYLLTTACFVATAALLLLIVRSPFGLALQGIRESPSRMAALGYNVWLHRYVASIIAALLAGLAGALHAWHNGIVTPGQMSLITSAEALLMVILGGAGTIIGPVMGAVVIVLFEFLVNRYTDRWVSVLGLIYIVLVVAAPQGLYTPIRAQAARFLRRRAAAPPPGSREA
jgi:branched-chain amino acid transport system permease protein